MRRKYEEIDHTADVGLRIYGETLEALLIHAAEGLFYIIGSNTLLSKSAGQAVTKTIIIESSDLETLLKDWLSELLYLHSSNHCYFNKFSIQSISDTGLIATVTGFGIPQEQEKEIQDVKAVTYHGLEVAQTDEGFEAQVIFDI